MVRSEVSPRGIKVILNDQDQWTCNYNTTHISPSTDIDSLASEVGFLPPEQLYLDNHLTFTFNNTFELSFRAADALKLCDPQDWTFNPRDYVGSFWRSNISNENSKEDCAELDIALLQKKDPILFYANVVLYEDELHDHGHCSLSVKTVGSLSLFLLKINLSVLESHVFILPCLA